MKKSQHHVNPHLIIQFQDGKTYFSPGALTHRPDDMTAEKHSEKAITFTDSTSCDVQEVAIDPS